MSCTHDPPVSTNATSLPTKCFISFKKCKIDCGYKLLKQMRVHKYRSLFLPQVFHYIVLHNSESTAILDN